MSVKHTKMQVMVTLGTGSVLTCAGVSQSGEGYIGYIGIDQPQEPGSEVDERHASKGFSDAHVIEVFTDVAAVDRHIGFLQHIRGNMEVKEDRDLGLGPASHDGHDNEGFVGGCDRMGCASDAGCRAGPHPDDRAVDEWAALLKAKMAASRAKGRDGWTNRLGCSAGHLANMLVNHLPKGNPGNFEDIGCLTMMLSMRGDHEQVLATALARYVEIQHRVPDGATHMSEEGQFYLIPPEGKEDGTWGFWDHAANDWRTTEATSMLPMYKLTQGGEL